MIETKNGITSGGQTHYSGLILLKPTPDAAIQTVIRKRGNAVAGYESLGSFYSYEHNGNMHLMYNHVTPRQRKSELVFNVLDNNLNHLHTEISPYESSKVFVALNGFKGNIPEVDNKKMFLAFTVRPQKF